jgi:hypothetical protein
VNAQEIVSRIFSGGQTAESCNVRDEGRTFDFSFGGGVSVTVTSGVSGEPIRLPVDATVAVTTVIASIPRKETDVERHLRFADDYAGTAEMHVQCAIRHCQDANTMGSNIELADSSAAVLRGQVELLRAADAMRKIRP